MKGCLYFILFVIALAIFIVILINNEIQYQAEKREGNPGLEQVDHINDSLESKQNLKVKDAIAVDKSEASKERVNVKFDYQEVTRDGVKYYIFHKNKKPKLKLVGHNIADISDINFVLEYLGLPKVKKVVKELEELNGSRTGRASYRWDTYAHGVLTIDRSLCGDGGNYYDCIWRVSVSSSE